MISTKNFRNGLLVIGACLGLCFLFGAEAHCQSLSTLTGTIVDSQQNPINGQLIMQLPAPASDGVHAISPIPVYFTLQNGAIQNGPQLEDLLAGCPSNCAVQPQGLYYMAKAYNTAGQLVFNGNYVVTGSTYNLGQARPTNITTNNISYAGVPLLTTSNTFTGLNIFNGGLVPNVGTYMAMTSFSGPVDGQLWWLTDAPANGYCGLGGGTVQTLCAYNSTSSLWVSAGSVEQSITGSCAGTASASTTIYFFNLGEIATLNCTNATGGFPAPLPIGGNVWNLRVSCGTGGISSSSGVVTVYVGGTLSPLTCTLGTGTSCSDANVSHVTAAGANSSVRVQMTTQGSETLANCQVSLNI